MKENKSHSKHIVKCTLYRFIIELWHIILILNVSFSTASKKQKQKKKPPLKMLLNSKHKTKLVRSTFVN